MTTMGYTPKDEQERHRADRRWVRPRPLAQAAVALSMAAGLTISSFVALSPAGATTRQAQTAPAMLEAFTVTGHGKVLVNSKHFSLYGLTSDRLNKLACAATCLKFWPPMLVSSSVTSISVGPGVAGKVGFVKRSATKKQVTFNGYPLYQFIKDKAPAQANGEGVAAFNGVWGLVRASARTKATSLILPAAAGTTTTTKPASGGGY